MTKKKYNIDELREQINLIDDKLLKLFQKRMKIAEHVAEYKKENNLPVLNENREKEVLSRLVSQAEDPFSSYVYRLYEKIFELSCEYQESLHQKDRFALIGGDLRYSFSKDIHAFFASYNYEYITIKSKEDVKDFLSRREVSGCNITNPYKRVVYSLCSEVSDCAKATGTINTVVVKKDGSLYGDNTDYYGFSYMAKRIGVDFNGKKVLVFGDGATSGTVSAVVRDSGGKLVVISRTGRDNYTNLSEHKDAEILINATPVGTYPETENQITDLSNFPKCEAVLDVVYNPLKSRFVQQALEKGLKASGGLPMLVAQAKKAAEIFSGKKISEDKIESVLHEIQLQKQNVVLIGMPGSGKSTVAVLLAKNLGKNVIDIDEEIVKQEHMSIPEIFEQNGEMYFRVREGEVIADNAKKSGVILSTGGGSVLTNRNRKNLIQNGFIVYLNRKLESLSTEGRPLSTDMETLKKMYEEREPIYKECCDIEIDNNGTPLQTVKNICAALKRKCK